MRKLMHWYLLSSVLLATNAWAQSVYESRSGLYQLRVPQAWSVIKQRGREDVVIAPAGGIGRGSIYVILSKPRGTLEDEAEYAFSGSQGKITSKRKVPVDRFSCLHVGTTNDRDVSPNNVFCQFTAPYSEGPARVSFRIGQTIYPEEKARQETLFWEVVNSVKFLSILTP